MRGAVSSERVFPKEHVLKFDVNAEGGRPATRISGPLAGGGGRRREQRTRLTRPRSCGGKGIPGASPLGEDALLTAPKGTAVRKQKRAPD